MAWLAWNSKNIRDGTHGNIRDLELESRWEEGMRSSPEIREVLSWKELAWIKSSCFSEYDEGKEEAEQVELSWRDEPTRRRVNSYSYRITRATSVGVFYKTNNLDDGDCLEATYKYRGNANNGILTPLLRMLVATEWTKLSSTPKLH